MFTGLVFVKLIYKAQGLMAIANFLLKFSFLNLTFFIKNSDLKRL